MLRKKIDADILITDRELAQINPHFPLWVDARQVQQIAEQTAPALSDLEAALELCAGPLLADHYDDWISAPRHHLRGLYIHLLLQIAEHARTRADYPHAIQVAQRVLAVENVNEHAHQIIMSCYAASDNRVLALKQYEECVRLLADDLGATPGAETIRLYEWIKQIETRAPARILTNLPTLPTTFIGRAREIAQVKQLVAANRVVTLTGVGGCGKTRLAIQVARDLFDAQRFPDGVWLVELAMTMDSADVPRAVCKALGLGQVEQSLAEIIRERAMLIVLDNCEHLIGACAELTDTLVRAAPNLQMLCTSRESLGITGEIVWQVPSLNVPANHARASFEMLAQCDAVQLFVDRAARVALTFALTEQNAPAVAQIACCLDGIPLALELAAARVKALSVEQIATRLDDRFHLLTGGSCTALPRHQTLRAAIDWGYALLADLERALLHRLAVFVGGWTLEAAEAICADARIVPEQILDLLARLADKSFIIVEEAGGAARYRMLETMRQYARDRLLEAEDAAAVRARHRDWFLQFAEAGELGLRGTLQIAWLERLEIEQANLRVALEWSLGRQTVDEADALKGLRLASALWQFWAIRGYLREGREWLERAREKNYAATELRAKSFGGAGVLAYLQGDLERAVEMCDACLADADTVADKVVVAAALFVASESARVVQRDCARADYFIAQSRALARQSSDGWLMAITQFNLGLQERAQGNLPGAIHTLESSVALCRELGDQWLCAAALDTLGVLVRSQNDLPRAARLWNESLQLRRNLQDKGGIAGSLNNLGEVARAQGEFARAIAYYEESLALFRELGQRASAPVVLNGLGFAALGASDPRRAENLFAESLKLFRELDQPQGIGLSLLGRARVAFAEADLERAARELGAAEAWLATRGDLLAPADRAEWDRLRDTLRIRVLEENAGLANSIS